MASEHENKPKDDRVRFTVTLSPAAYEALERLRMLSGKSSAAETIASAMSLYGVQCEWVQREPV